MKKTILSFFTIAMLLCINVYAGDVGKIVFSKTPVDSKTAESLPPTEFQVGDKIYCWVFLSQPLSDYKVNNPQSWDSQVPDYLIKLSISFDGAEVQTGIYSNRQGFSSKENKTVTSYSFVLGYYKDERDGGFTDLVNGLQTGAHTFSVKAYLEYRDKKKPTIIAVGESKLNKTENAFLKTECTLKSEMNDPELEKKSFQAVKEFLKDKYGDVVKGAITSKDWEIQYNSNGAILGRAIYVTVLTKKPNTKICEYSSWPVVQAYEGAGNYQKSLTVYNVLASTSSKDRWSGTCDCE